MGWTVPQQLPVLREVVENLVVVCFRVGAGPAAVSEDHLLFGLVAQSQVGHIQLDLPKLATVALAAVALPPPLSAAATLT